MGIVGMDHFVAHGWQQSLHLLIILKGFWEILVAKGRIKMMISITIQDPGQEIFIWQFFCQRTDLFKRPVTLFLKAIIVQYKGFQNIRICQ